LLNVCGLPVETATKQTLGRHLRSNIGWTSRENLESANFGSETCIARRERRGEESQATNVPMKILLT